ncbi:MAG: molybdate ABC transporter substrate-binding protein [Oscillospiraceae bacterium]|jgi:molybdate transport system substrate-binding protein|nr:molybdate ABC transporter substrate-binding protein [Oscillospiraceae bacterium]
MKKLFAMLLVVCMLGVLFAGCGTKEEASSSQSTSATTAEPVEINVFAAASLTDALDKIIAKYKTVAPNITVTPNYGSSGTLQTQIEEGATADLFISAAQKQMDALAENFVLNGSRKNLLKNTLVLVVPKGSTKGIASFEDVATDKVGIISLGNADVPCGQYAEETFAFLKNWDTVKAKASFGENVKTVLSQVQHGSADAGVVYSTDASGASDVEIVATAPEGSHKAIVYPAAVLKTSTKQDAAQAFLDYLSTEAAKAEFTAVGFAIAE